LIDFSRLPGAPANLVWDDTITNSSWKNKRSIRFSRPWGGEFERGLHRPHPMLGTGRHGRPFLKLKHDFFVFQTPNPGVLDS
jgi:hypothetical protein